MGILVAIGAIGQVANTANAVATVWSKLNEPRAVLIEFSNHTDHNLRIRDEPVHSSGGFGEPPNQEIPSKLTDIFGSQSRGGSILEGTHGSMAYTVGDTGASAIIRWDNPFFGANSSSAIMEGEKGHAFKITDLMGSGFKSHVKYEIRQDRPLSHVRGPDYRWYRHEGYAYDPNHSPPDRRTFELHSWYSPGREDNHATTNPDYNRSLTTQVGPDYNHTRLEGYIIPPDETGDLRSMVPLHSWWSQQRGDNFTSTDPRYVTPTQPQVDPDYRHYRHEGWLFSPQAPQPAGTVPVHSWWSPGRGDNFLTSNPSWRP